MRYRYGARRRWVRELVMTTASSLKPPAICLQELDPLTTLHGVYYTHHLAGEAWAHVVKT